MYIVPMQIDEVNFHFTKNCHFTPIFCILLHFCILFILHQTHFSLSCVSPSLPSLWRSFSSKPLPQSSTFYMALARSTYPEGLQPSEFRWRIFPPLYSPSFYTNGACGQGVIEGDFFLFIAHWYALKICKKKKKEKASSRP